MENFEPRDIRSSRIGWVIRESHALDQSSLLALSELF